MCIIFRHLHVVYLFNFSFYKTLNFQITKITRRMFLYIMSDGIIQRECKHVIIKIIEFPRVSKF